MTFDKPSPASTLSASDDEEDRVFAERMAYYDRRNNRDEVEDKIGREIYVMGGGAIDAGKAAFSREHGLETTLTALGSTAAGFAIRAAEAKVPALRPVLAIGATALTVSFVRDLLGQGQEIGGILKDTWNNRDHNEQNRQAFAQHGGKFAFDLALSTAAGLGGSKLANHALFGPTSNYMRINTYDTVGLRGKQSQPVDRLYSKDDPLAALYQQTLPSTLKFQAQVLKGAKAGSKFSGNAFLISEDGLAVTNNHCVELKDVLTVTDHLGVTHKARVVAANRVDDVAILQVEKAASAGDRKFQPLKLAAENARPGDNVFVLSHQSQMPSVTLAPGRVREYQTLSLNPQVPAENAVSGSLLRVHPFTREVLPVQPKDRGLVDTQRMLASYFSKGGISGSAVINDAGEVVGMHTGTLGRFFRQLTARNDATPVSAISKLLSETVAQRY